MKMIFEEILAIIFILILIFAKIIIKIIIFWDIKNYFYVNFSSRNLVDTKEKWVEKLLTPFEFVFFNKNL